MAAPCKWSRPRETRLQGSWECFPPDIHHIASTYQVVSEFLWVTLKSEQESNLIIQLTESAVIVVRVVESIYEIPTRVTFLLFVLSSTFYYFSIILKTFRSHIVIPLAVKLSHEHVITPIQHSAAVKALTILSIYWIALADIFLCQRSQIKYLHAIAVIKSSAALHTVLVDCSLTDRTGLLIHLKNEPH